MTTSSRASVATDALRRVRDPEIPVLTIADLGILRDVVEHDGGRIEVVITPTYSGCPAMHAIREDIERELAAEGFAEVTVTQVLHPAWTTDWMSQDGRRKLKEFGIAPPTGGAPSGPVPVSLGRRPVAATVACPRCDGPGRESSRFGSTACKAMYVCTVCSEPFDYFKHI